jgi:hypothetical protein
MTRRKASSCRAQVVDLARQNRGRPCARRNQRKELRIVGAVEIPAEVGHIVQYLDVALQRRTPFDEIHERSRMRA